MSVINPDFNKKRIAIDMDEVIADTVAKFAHLYQRDHGISLTPELLHGKEIREALPPDLIDTVREYINQKGFFRDLEVMPDSQRVLEELAQKYDVFIVSAAMEFPNSLEDKLHWLGDHFPFISWTNIIFCGYKIINTDIIIDDRTKNFKGFAGRTLLYSSPHNALLTEFERVSSWNEVAGLLL